MKSIKSYDYSETIVDYEPEIVAQTGVSAQTLDIVSKNNDLKVVALAAYGSIELHGLHDAFHKPLPDELFYQLGMVQRHGEVLGTEPGASPVVAEPETNRHLVQELTLPVAGNTGHNHQSAHFYAE